MIKPPGFLEEDFLLPYAKDYYYSFGDYTQGEGEGVQRVYCTIRRTVGRARISPKKKN